MNLTGYIRNLADGRVKLVLEGNPEITAEALGRVRHAMAGYIDGEEQASGPATGEFKELGIKR